MVNLRPSYLDQMRVLTSVDDTVPRCLIDAVCSYPENPSHGAFDLTRELQVACLVNDPDRVTDMLQLGADRDALNPSGLSAVDIADWLTRVTVLKRLLADINIPEAGLRELLYAIRDHRSTVVRVLLEMGVKEQLDDVLFLGVLQMACSISTTFVVKALVNYGPETNVSALEPILVRVAILWNNIHVAEFVRDLAMLDRRIINQEAERYILPDSYWGQSGSCRMVISEEVQDEDESE